MSSSNVHIRPKESSEISQQVLQKFYTPITSSKISIFLCGASMSKQKMVRYQIFEIFKNIWNSYQYDIILPEDIFEELLYNSNDQDLLSLENLLAESIDVIIIIPESPGSFTELGAFANDEKLRSKIICLVDEKYKKDKSFIKQGPLKLIKKSNPHGLVYIEPSNLIRDFKKIQPAVKEIKKNSPARSTTKISLLQLDNFLLPIIYLLEPISKKTIENFVENVITDINNTDSITTTSITLLVKKKFIELTQDGYKLTKLGVDHYLSLKKVSSRNKIQKEVTQLDNLRLEILNLSLRNKKLKI